jgi:hypothetical protein
MCFEITVVELWFCTMVLCNLRSISWHGSHGFIWLYRRKDIALERSLFTIVQTGTLFIYLFIYLCIYLFIYARAYLYITIISTQNDNTRIATDCIVKIHQFWLAFAHYIATKLTNES